MYHQLLRAAKLHEPSCMGNVYNVIIPGRYSHKLLKQIVSWTFFHHGLPSTAWSSPLQDQEKVYV